jgi:hypothetical protein
MTLGRMLRQMQTHDSAIKKKSQNVPKCPLFSSNFARAIRQNLTAAELMTDRAEHASGGWDKSIGKEKPGNKDNTMSRN